MCHLNLFPVKTIPSSAQTEQEADKKTAPHPPKKRSACSLIDPAVAAAAINDL